MAHLRKNFILCLLLLLTSCGQAPQTVSVDQTWARATKPGQEVAAAYMTLISKQNTELFKIESDVSSNVEIHSMSMDNGVMEMRMLDTLALEKNKPYKLEPGGFHLMLFDLKKPLSVGDNIKFKLYFKDTAGKVETVDISSPVREGEPD